VHWVHEERASVAAAAGEETQRRLVGLVGGHVRVLAVMSSNHCSSCRTSCNAMPIRLHACTGRAFTT
jgi:hypothetical protein